MVHLHARGHATKITHNKKTLEAQQQYFSYRAMLTGTISQKYFVFVFMGYRTFIARQIAKRGIAKMCLCETKHQTGYRTNLGECKLPLENIAQYGVCNDNIAISRAMGPLRRELCKNNDFRSETADKITCIVQRQLKNVSGDFLGVFGFLKIACSLGIPQENL